MADVADLPREFVTAQLESLPEKLRLRAVELIQKRFGLKKRKNWAYPDRTGDAISPEAINQSLDNKHFHNHMMEGNFQRQMNIIVRAEFYTNDGFKRIETQAFVAQEGEDVASRIHMIEEALFRRINHEFWPFRDLRFVHSRDWL